MRKVIKIIIRKNSGVPVDDDNNDYNSLKVDDYTCCILRRGDGGDDKW